MKKLFAAMMALCLMLGAFAAFAAETDTTVVRWSDHEADAAKIEGQFATVGNTGLKMYIPAEFKDTELSQETLDSGTFMVLKTEKEEKAVVSAQVVKKDFDSFKAALKAEGKTVWDITVNGMPCLEFNVDVNGVVTSCFVFAAEQGKVLVFNFTLGNQEPYTSIYKVMASSIQPAQ